MRLNDFRDKTYDYMLISQNYLSGWQDHSYTLQILYWR